jgi:hypothetical protein
MGQFLLATFSYEVETYLELTHYLQTLSLPESHRRSLETHESRRVVTPGLSLFQAKGNLLFNLSHLRYSMAVV